MQEKPAGIKISEEAYKRLVLEEMLLSEHSSRDNNLITIHGYSRRVNTDDPIEVFMHFVASVSNGITPTADVLEAVAKGLREYICNPRAVEEPLAKLKSIDECFNLKPKKGGIHPINKSVRRIRRRLFLMQMRLTIKKAESIGDFVSIEDAADVVASKYGLPSGEALRKEYSAIDWGAEEARGEKYINALSPEIRLQLENKIQGISYAFDVPKKLKKYQRNGK